MPNGYLKNCFTGATHLSARDAFCQRAGAFWGAAVFGGRAAPWPLLGAPP